MNTYQLQAAFARKREADFIRYEKNSEINRYFDHWNKVTAKHEAWTAPEYYKNAENTLKKQNEQKIKNKKIQERREKLRKLYQTENFQYEEELQKNVLTPRTKKLTTNFLQKMDENLKEKDDRKRRLELEAKLYGKLRYGIMDENALYDSTKNDHQVLAKLNWLDKQIENQIEREKQEKEAEERKLLLEVEARKYEEHLKERQKIRESEIKELRLIQENNLKELRDRELETETLQNEENILKRNLEEIENIIIKYCEKNLQKQTEMIIPNNIKRIKMILRQYLEKYRENLKNDIGLLKDLKKYNIYEENIQNLIEKYESYYDFEIQKQLLVESMYESEAKNNLIKWKEQWLQEDVIREKQIINLLNKQKNYINDKLSENLKQQKSLVEIRETHLNAIENSNEKLKILIKEEEIYNKQNQQTESEQQEKEINGEMIHSSENILRTSRSLSSSSSSLSSILKHNESKSESFGRKKNLTDNESYEQALIKGVSSACSIGSQSSRSSIGSGPKFGRKKVAWT